MVILLSGVRNFRQLLPIVPSNSREFSIKNYKEKNVAETLAKFLI